MLAALRFRANLNSVYGIAIYTVYCSNLHRNALLWHIKRCSIYVQNCMHRDQGVECIYANYLWAKVKRFSNSQLSLSRQYIYLELLIEYVLTLFSKLIKKNSNILEWWQQQGSELCELAVKSLYFTCCQVSCLMSTPAMNCLAMSSSWRLSVLSWCIRSDAIWFKRVTVIVDLVYVLRRFSAENERSALRLILAL
jgi:hypothetical protein